MITVYTKDNCPFCDMAKALLEARGVEYNTINVSEKSEARDYLIENGHRSVPQIFRGTTHIPGGYQGMAGMSDEEFNIKVRGEVK
jgi:glutaredoxin